MGLRFRRSLKIAPGIRLNFSRSGVGFSLGGRGYTITASSRGSAFQTFSLPGTGLSYRVESSSKRSRGKSASAGSTEAPVRLNSAGRRASGARPFAPPGEKALYAALCARDIAGLDRIIYQFPDYSVPAAALAGIAMAKSAPVRARQLLEWVIQTGQDPAGHPFFKNYRIRPIEVDLAPGITAHIRFGKDAVVLVLAELRQSAGDLAGAIDLVESLKRDIYVAVSLAELYVLAGRFDEVIALTERTKNENDAAAFLLIARAVAFREKGFPEAARTALNEALSSKKRSPAIRHRALFERARTYLEEGKRSQARRDLERILAEDSDYPGLKEMLLAVGANLEPEVSSSEAQSGRDQ